MSVARVGQRAKYDPEPSFPCHGGPSAYRLAVLLMTGYLVRPISMPKKMHAVTAPLTLAPMTRSHAFGPQFMLNPTPELSGWSHASRLAK